MSDEPPIDALKAISHPVRFRILETLALGECNVGELEDTSEIGQPALSQQLAVLRNTDLVLTRKKAKLVFYRLNQKRLQELAAMIGKLGSGQPHASALQGRSKEREAIRGVANFARMG